MPKVSISIVLFPDFTLDGNNNSSDGRPREVAAWMKFQKENPIAFSLSYHGEKFLQSIIPGTIHLQNFRSKIRQDRP